MKEAYTSPAEKMLLEIRQQNIAKLRTLILGALGVTEEQLAEKPISQSFMFSEGDTVTCSASRLGKMIVASVHHQEPPEATYAGLHMVSSARYDLVGDSDFILEEEEFATDADGNRLSGEEVAEIIGHEVFPVYKFRGDLTFLEDYTFLVDTLTRLQA